MAEDTVNSSLTPPPDEVTAAEVAVTSAAADDPPGAKRRPGRPKGSKTAKPRTAAQKAAFARAQQARRLGPKAPTAARPAVVTDAKLAEAVNNMYAMAGLGVGFAGLTDVGMALAGCAPNAGVAWVNLARTNPALRRALETLAATSAAGDLLMAHAPLFALVIGKVNPALAHMMPGRVADPPPTGLGDPAPADDRRHAMADGVW